MFDYSEEVCLYQPSIETFDNVNSDTEYTCVYKSSSSASSSTSPSIEGFENTSEDDVCTFNPSVEEFNVLEEEGICIYNVVNENIEGFQTWNYTPPGGNYKNDCTSACYGFNGKMFVNKGPDLFVNCKDGRSLRRENGCSQGYLIEYRNGKLEPQLPEGVYKRTCRDFNCDGSTLKASCPWYDMNNRGYAEIMGWRDSQLGDVCGEANKWVKSNTAGILEVTTKQDSDNREKLIDDSIKNAQNELTKKIEEKKDCTYSLQSDAESGGKNNTSDICSTLAKQQDIPRNKDAYTECCKSNSDVSTKKCVEDVQGCLAARLYSSYDNTKENPALENHIDTKIDGIEVDNKVREYCLRKVKEIGLSDSAKAYCSLTTTIRPGDYNEKGDRMGDYDPNFTKDSPEKTKLCTKAVNSCVNEVYKSYGPVFGTPIYGDTPEELKQKIDRLKELSETDKAYLVPLPVESEPVCAVKTASEICKILKESGEVGYRRAFSGAFEQCCGGKEETTKCKAEIMGCASVYKYGNDFEDIKKSTSLPSPKWCKREMDTPFRDNHMDAKYRIMDDQKQKFIESCNHAFNHGSPYTPLVPPPPPPPPGAPPAPPPSTVPHYPYPLTRTAGMDCDKNYLVCDGTTLKMTCSKRITEAPGGCTPDKNDVSKLIDTKPLPGQSDENGNRIWIPYVTTQAEIEQMQAGDKAYWEMLALGPLNSAQLAALRVYGNDFEKIKALAKENKELVNCLDLPWGNWGPCSELAQKRARFRTKECSGSGHGISYEQETCKVDFGEGWKPFKILADGYCGGGVQGEVKKIDGRDKVVCPNGTTQDFVCQNIRCDGPMITATCTDGTGLNPKEQSMRNDVTPYCYQNFKPSQDTPQGIKYRATTYNVGSQAPWGKSNNVTDFGVPCEVSQWSSWSECNKLGEKYRTRTVTKQAENNGQCPVLSETEKCIYIPKEPEVVTIPVKAEDRQILIDNRVFSEWQDVEGSANPSTGKKKQRRNLLGEKVDCKYSGTWTDVPNSCNQTTGRKKQTRAVASQPVLGGECVTEREVGCPVDCQYSGDWTDVPDSCDIKTGKKKQTRQVSVQGRNGGVACVTNQEVNCPVNCQYSEWTDVPNSCNVTTGKKRQIKTTTPPKNGGTACQTGPGITEKEVDCPVDCQYSAWTNTTTCDPATGKLKQTRTVTAQPKNGGAACQTGMGFTEQIGSTDCKVDCVLTDWYNIKVNNERGDECIKTGNLAGKQYKRRDVVYEAKNGGNTCETQSKLQTVNCPLDCEWSAWTPSAGTYGQCPNDYKINSWDPDMAGYKFESRYKTGFEMNGGQCPSTPGATSQWYNGKYTEFKQTQCSCDGLQRNCTWGAWGAWGQCGSSGKKYRFRTKTVSERCGGTCTGTSYEEATC